MSARQVAWTAVVGAGLVAAGLLAWTLRNYRLEAIVHDGIRRLAQAQTPSELEAALAQWRERTEPYWADRRGELVRYVFSHYPLEDYRVRRLLAQIAGVDFGDRIEDWRRWYTAYRDSLGGGRGSLAGKPRIRLRRLWSAPVGLTAPFSTILCLDGSLYVPSLGRGFRQPDDTGDAIVRVDGRTGEVERVFEPAGRPPRDILGLAAADGLILASCQNGFVYAVTPGGALRWRGFAAAGILTPPLAVDVNRDGVCDVVVITELGRAVALSGNGGAALWTKSVSAASRVRFAESPGELPGAVAFLALGNLLADRGPQILAACRPGDLRALDPVSGRELWRGRVPGELTGGIVLTADAGGAAAAAYLGDSSGRLWGVQRSGEGLALTNLLSVGDGPTGPILAPLRTLGQRGGPPSLVAAGRAEPGGGQSILVLCSQLARLWRVSMPGTVRAAPAVADLNGDSVPELVAAVVDESGDGGRLVIVSAAGHTLADFALSAPPASAPIVADADGDGVLEVLLADGRGLLHCFTTGRFGVVEWGFPGGDPRNTCESGNAYLFSQTPTGLQWRWRPTGG